MRYLRELSSVVKLTSKGDEACSVLGVSWHGPHSATGQKKQDVLKGLSLFLKEICRKTNVSSIIIGGDFNLNTLDENGLRESNVYFPCYKLSPRGERAKERKGPGRRYIAYKDNFAIITTSPSVVRPGDMKLSKVKPLSEGKDILDHDPIIGVLQLRSSGRKKKRAPEKAPALSVLRPLLPSACYAGYLPRTN